MEHMYSEDRGRPTTATVRPVDSIESTLRAIAYSIFTGAFGFLPLLFLPVVYAPADYTKTLFIILAVLIGAIFLSLSILRSGALVIVKSWPLLALWGIGLTTLIAALLSGDMYDSLIGDTLSVHSAMFVGLIAVIASISAILGQEKAFVMRTYIALAGSAFVLGLFHILRVIFGPEFLSFGIFGATTSSMFGGWNDLALFFGLAILLSMVALEQLPLTKWGKILFSAVVGVSLLMLAVVNFFAVWFVLALVSLMVLMYSLTKDRFVSASPSLFAKPNIAISSIIVSAVVFVVSLVFVVGGTVVGGLVSNVTGVSYVEVRPSLSATVDITRQVYQENAFTGIGPNKFVDAWRLYKDPSLNETIFWATDFASGSGYVTTQFITTGVLGALAWAIFMGAFLFAGLRMLFKGAAVDKFWYFIGTSAFVAAAFLWLMTWVYTPGATILLLTAFFTGVTFAAGAALSKDRLFTWSIEQNRRAGFALVGVVMLVIVASASSLYYVGRHYAAVYTFSGAVSGLDGSTTLAEVEQTIAQSFSMVQSDEFARQLALYQLAKMNSLLAVPEPTPEEQQQFQLAATTGVNAAQQSLAIDSTNPQNASTLGAIFSVLAAAGVEGAGDRAREAYAVARERDPRNPSYALLEAQLMTRTNDAAGAREKIREAVALKSNYTDALFFSAQLDVTEGKVEDAIATTRAIIMLEPNNPARYYQLGVLYFSTENYPAAIEEFAHAVQLDPNYANARYFLALSYSETDNTAAALEQLEIVQRLNPDNAQVATLIADLRAGRPIVTNTTNTEQVVESQSTVTTEGETVTTSESPDTPLIVPINPVGQEIPAENVTTE